MQWTIWERELIFRMKDGRLSDAVIARVMSAICSTPVFPLDIELADARPPRKRAKSKHDYSAPFDQRADNIVSCILHHSDLLRAGHTPAGTEFEIGSDGSPRRYERHKGVQSYCGSAAASCVEVA